jgi:8-hydroxy-5-deazaflavin:NADPH oxidoreductase
MTDVTAGEFGTLGILGGTGPQGRGLAIRFAQAGISVMLGSRDATRAGDVAAGLGHGIRGSDNARCAKDSDLVIVAVPWDGHGELLASLSDELAHKIVVDCVNPLGFDKQGPFGLAVEAGSACEQAQAILSDSTVVGAFHHLSAELLEDPSVTSIDADVLVLGDDRDATDRIQALAEKLPGVRGVYAGRLRNAHQVEAFTANLIAINRRYKTHSGVRVAGV